MSHLKKLPLLIATLTFLASNAAAEETNNQPSEEVIAQVQTLKDEMNAQKPKRNRVQRRTRVTVNPDAMLLVYDPWEPMNRAIYNFNALFDRHIFLPTVDGYRAITPDIVETGISNFFSNLMEVRNLFNNILQLKIKDSGVTLGRFVTNTTVGVLGLWDPATEVGLFEKREDFGQTLGYWGVKSGPYFVIPFLGPSTLRDASGFGVDFAVNYKADLLNIYDDANKEGISIGTNLLQAIDTRKNTAFRYYGSGSPFEYELIRYAFEEKRKIEIAK